MSESVEHVGEGENVWFWTPDGAVRLPACTRFGVIVAAGGGVVAISSATDSPSQPQVGGAERQGLSFADSSGLRAGDLAIAIGNPLGLRSSVSEGIVSAFRQGVLDEVVDSHPAFPGVRVGATDGHGVLVGAVAPGG